MLMSKTKVNPPSLPLDIGQFNAVTGGRGTYQEELLELFFQNSAECIQVMKNNCAPDQGDKWQDAIEELKNISSSIGALELSKVCAIAGKMGSAPEEEKQKI